MKPDRTHVLSALAFCAGFAYCTFLLEILYGFPLDPMVGYLSELEALDQPTSVVARSMNTLAGMLMIAVALGLLLSRQVRAERRGSLSGILLGVFGLCVVLESAIPMACATSLSMQCAIEDSASPLLSAHTVHMVLSVVADAVMVALVIVLAWPGPQRSPRSERSSRLGEWLRVLALAVIVVSLAAAVLGLVGQSQGSVPPGTGVVQRIQVWLLAIVVVLTPTRISQMKPFGHLRWRNRASERDDARGPISEDAHE